jgi:putative transcriptional regulator
MKIIQVTIDPNDPSTLKGARLDLARVDATTEEEIQAQIEADDKEAMMDAAKFARRVRARLGLSQAQLSERINVSVETIRNWEQGRRYPTGAAKALLKILDRAPEVSLLALN